MTDHKETPFLPDGVPADNAGLRRADDRPHYAAPDAVNPRFEIPAQPAAASAFTPIETKTAQDAGAPMRIGDRNNMALLISLVALILALGGVFMVSKPRNPLPECSAMPDWNQFNCTP